MKLSDVKTVLMHSLDANLLLAEMGRHLIPYNLVGHAGIAKTALIQTIANERGCALHIINPAQFEEVGDFQGMPLKSYTMIKDEEEMLVTEANVAHYIDIGWKLCPNCEPITTYAPPSWVPKEDGKEHIFMIDDANRGTKSMNQGMMQLLQWGTYGTWSLPKKCHIILTSNPSSDPSYQVTELDSAMTTRMMNLYVDFDVQTWASWATSQSYPDTLVNFALINSVIFDDPNHLINARSYTMFMDCLTGVKITSANLPLISLMAKGAFGQNENISDLMTQFIIRKLDKLPTPEKIITGDWKTISALLESIIYESGTKSQGVAFCITSRLIDFIKKVYTDSSLQAYRKNDIVLKRLGEIVCYSRDVKDLLNSCDITMTINELYTLNPKALKNIASIDGLTECIL